MSLESRRLEDLVSVGPATVKDFHILGITAVEQLKNQSADGLYGALCQKTAVQHDICCLDVFSCAIAQAINPALPKEECKWWFWSKKRKSGR